LLNLKHPEDQGGLPALNPENLIPVALQFLAKYSGQKVTSRGDF